MAIAYAKSHASDEDQKEEEEEKTVVAPIAAEVSSPPVAV